MPVVSLTLLASVKSVNSRAPKTQLSNIAALIYIYLVISTNNTLPVS